MESDIKSQQRSRPREEDIKLIKRNQQSEHKGKKEERKMFHMKANDEENENQQPLARSARKIRLEGIMKNVGDDGHCYFRCISLAFTDSENEYMKFRHEIANMLSVTNNIYKSSLIGNESLEDHLADMGKSKENSEIWANEAEIYATFK